MSGDRSDQSRSLKKGIDPNDVRRRKQDTTLTIRKNKRAESIQKRRQPERAQQQNQQQQQQVSYPPTSKFDPETAILTRVYESSVIYDKKQEVIFDPAELPRLTDAIHSDDPRLVLLATSHFRKLLSIEIDPPITQVIQCPGVIEKFVSFLKLSDNPALQFEAAWALTNVASGTSAQTREVVRHNAIPLFVHLLSSPNLDVKEQSVWALGNIAGDSTTCRDLVLDHNALEPLIKCLYNAKRVTMLRNATWAISNLSRGKPAPPFHRVKMCLPVLARLIFCLDDEVVTDACWALSYLSEGSNEKIQALIDVSVCRRLVELLMHPHPGVITPALRTIGNVVTGDDRQTQAVIDAFAIPALVAQLASPKKGIQKEACWTLSNITAGSRSQIGKVIEAGAIKPLVDVLKSQDFDIKKEAAWALANACSGGTEKQIHAVVDEDFIPPLIDMLNSYDPRMSEVLLEALDRILRAGQQLARRQGLAVNPYAQKVERAHGVPKLNVLMNSDHPSLHTKAASILSTFFESVDDVDSTIAPIEGEDHFSVQAPELDGLKFDEFSDDDPDLL